MFKMFKEFYKTQLEKTKEFYGTHEDTIRKLTWLPKVVLIWIFKILSYDLNEYDEVYDEYGDPIRIYPNKVNRYSINLVFSK